jgi:Family of unknown function (DUF5681)
LAMMRPKDSLGSAVEPRRETHRSERERLAGARTAGVSRAVSSFKPGRSGNSGGRPKAEVQALARTFTERAIKTLGEITEDVKAPPAARALAANALLDRAWGRDRSSLSCRLVTWHPPAQLWRRTSARFSPKLVGLFSSHGHSRGATEDPLSLLTACSMSAATALGCEK